MALSSAHSSQLGASDTLNPFRAAKCHRLSRSPGLLPCPAMHSPGAPPPRPHGRHPDPPPDIPPARLPPHILGVRRESPAQLLRRGCCAHVPPASASRQPRPGDSPPTWPPSCACPRSLSPQAARGAHLVPSLLERPHITQEEQGGSDPGRPPAGKRLDGHVLRAPASPRSCCTSPGPQEAHPQPIRPVAVLCRAGVLACPVLGLCSRGPGPTRTDSGGAH